MLNLLDLPNELIEQVALHLEPVSFRNLRVGSNKRIEEATRRAFRDRFFDRRTITVPCRQRFSKVVATAKDEFFSRRVETVRLKLLYHLKKDSRYGFKCQEDIDISNLSYAFAHFPRLQTVIFTYRKQDTIPCIGSSCMGRQWRYYDETAIEMMIFALHIALEKNPYLSIRNFDMGTSPCRSLWSIPSPYRLKRCLPLLRNLSSLALTWRNVEDVIAGRAMDAQIRDFLALMGSITSLKVGHDCRRELACLVQSGPARGVFESRFPNLKELTLEGLNLWRAQWQLLPVFLEAHRNTLQSLSISNVCCAEATQHDGWPFLIRLLSTILPKREDFSLHLSDLWVASSFDPFGSWLNPPYRYIHYALMFQASEYPQVWYKKPSRIWEAWHLDIAYASSERSGQSSRVLEAGMPKFVDNKALKFLSDKGDWHIIGDTLKLTGSVDLPYKVEQILSTGVYYVKVHDKEVPSTEVPRLNRRRRILPGISSEEIPMLLIVMGCSCLMTYTVGKFLDRLGDSWTPLISCTKA